MTEVQRVGVTMSGFDVNVYVVHAPEGEIIVDAGAEPEKILAATRGPVAAILLTHGHADHVSALDEVRSETGAPVYAHPEIAAEIGDYEPLRDGQELKVAGESFQVIHTPGHEPGSVTFVLGEDQIVGDLVLPNSVGRTDLPETSWSDISDSLRRVMPLWTENTRLYCGHGDVLLASEQVETNPYLPLGVVS
jgi:glyoxylase-like metal-dependent hydrolase (beta-lactamase superfamily II)